MSVFTGPVQSVLQGKRIGDIVCIEGESFCVQYISKKNQSPIELRRTSNEKNMHGSAFLNDPQVDKAVLDETPIIKAIYHAYKCCAELPVSEKALVEAGVLKRVATDYRHLRRLCAELGRRCCSSSEERFQSREAFSCAIKNCAKELGSTKGIFSIDAPYQILEEIKEIRSEYLCDYEVVIEYFILQKTICSYVKRVDESGSREKCGTKFPHKLMILPKSTILQAYLKRPGQGKAGCVTIVSDTNDQDAKQGVYWVGRALPAMILAAIRLSNDRRFVYKNTRYEVARYIKQNDAEKYFEIISRFCKPGSPQTLYVFAHKNILVDKLENYESVTAMIPCENCSFPVSVNVYYEKSSHKYFINEETYVQICKKYGLPYVRLKRVGESVRGNGFSKLRPYSELNLAGYSVNAETGLSLGERRTLLRQVIDSNILSKAQVINHIEWLIKTRSGQMNQCNAVAEWKSDLAYISAYQEECQRAVWIEKFKRNYKY